MATQTIQTTGIISLKQLKGDLKIRVKPRRSTFYGFRVVGLGQLTCKHCERDLDMMTVARCPRVGCHDGEGFYCGECQAMDCYKPECETLFVKPERQLYNIARYYDLYMPRPFL
ncbi:hypothetical protein BC938DRAFT_481999 [Jimgerdemannia flammicorona]|uniref:Uncharacterized protein n=1 Tax=Jimgerdemannia flammicorona TaxID=994334 RepID=A0A433QWJ9_9FUNG|nr:hypothetical protein BC938DRAFT_481999 [Jimgerdemannia flammicorona]